MVHVIVVIDDDDVVHAGRIHQIFSPSSGVRRKIESFPLI
jgi:hypothetical protein